MSGRRMSVNIKKIGAQTSANRLVRENYRDERNADQYDDGHRAIDTARTADNVYLIDPPDDYDQIRRDRISDINEQRSKNYDMRLRMSNNVEKLRQSGDLQAEKSREVAKTRKLRSDTVDTLGIVVQMPPEMAEVWSRDQQTQFFRDCLDYMREHPEEYGHIDTAVIHYDENSPHMQCLSSTLNQDTLTSDAKKIVGNKTKMSDRQTHLADAMQAKGWDVRRGVKRVNNPEYRNFKSDMDRLGIEVNRHNDAVLLDMWRDLQRREQNLKRGQADLKRGQDDLKQRSDALEPLEKEFERKAQDLNSWEHDLNTRQTAQDARQTAQDSRERELDAKQEESLKTADMASERITDLQAALTDLQAATQDGKETVKDIRAARQLRRSHGMTALQQARELDQQTDRARQAADDARAWIDSLNDLQGNDKGLSL